MAILHLNVQMMTVKGQLSIFLNRQNQSNQYVSNYSTYTDLNKKCINYVD